MDQTTLTIVMQAHENAHLKNHINQMTHRLAELERELEGLRRDATRAPATMNADATTV